MGDVVNLNRVRKGKARVDHVAQATANRAAYGRTAAQKQADREAAERQARLLDGARRED